MKTNMNPMQPLQLTATQKKELHEQELSSNPKDRLFTRYYPLTRQRLFSDYYITVERNKERDLETMEEARNAFDRTLLKLQSDYVKDVELLIEITLMECPMYIPIKAKITAIEGFAA